MRVPQTAGGQSSALRRIPILADDCVAGDAVADAAILAGPRSGDGPHNPSPRHELVSLAPRLASTYTPARKIMARAAAGVESYAAF